MELFNKKKISIHSPLEGEIIPLNEVKDEAFSQEMLGKGLAIMPSKGLVVAPCDGLIEVLFETAHAVTIRTIEGIDILIHIGIDTVKLGGVYFKAFVKQGDNIKKGTPLIAFDMKAIQDAGYDVTVPIVICNWQDFSQINILSKGTITNSTEIISLQK